MREPWEVELDVQKQVFPNLSPTVQGDLRDDFQVGEPTYVITDAIAYAADERVPIAAELIADIRATILPEADGRLYEVLSESLSALENQPVVEW